jgi:hypothetical protein
MIAVAVVLLFNVTTTTLSFEAMLGVLDGAFCSVWRPRIIVLVSRVYVWLDPSLAATVRLVGLAAVAVPGVTSAVSG